MDSINVKVGASPAVSAGVGIMPEYTGAYSVTPLIGQAVVLPTAKHIMRGNVTVGTIPITERENEAGGITLTVGGAGNG